MTTKRQPVFLGFYVIIFHVVLASAQLPPLTNFNLLDSIPIPEAWRTFGVYKAANGSLITPFGRFLPESLWLQSQSTTQPPVYPQCPCSTTGGQTECPAYNSGYQAATIEEALENFPNTLDVDSSNAKTIVPKKQNVTPGPSPRPDGVLTPESRKLVEKLMCEPTDYECLSCAKRSLMGMLDSLQSEPPSPVNAAVKAELLATIKANGLDNPTIPNRCQKLGLEEPGVAAPLERSVESPVVKAIGNCIEDATTTRIRTGQSTSYYTSKEKGKGKGTFAWDWRTRQRNQVNSTDGIPVRNKRQTFAKEIDQVMNVKCTRRGESTDGSIFVGLCNSCWKFGVLAPGYEPRYVNLLTCDTDTKCISGWGQCRQRTRNITVMKKNGSGYDQVSISIPVSCDCQVQAGSALHDFVKA